MSEDPKVAMVMLQQAEVMCLIVEHLADLTRPEGMTADEALNHLNIGKDHLEQVASAATAILEYVTGEIAKTGAATIDRHSGEGGMH